MRNEMLKNAGMRIRKRVRRSKKTGMPPGSLVPVGEDTSQPIKITVFDYDDKTLDEREYKTVEECFAYRDNSRVTWINVDGVSDVGAIERLGQHYGIHPLVLEDILNTTKRPKIEDYGDYIFVILKMVYPAAAGDTIRIEQVSLVIGKGFVLSFQQPGEDVFNSVRERLRTFRGKIRKMGADYLAYSLIDAVVDSYFIVLEQLGEHLDRLEETVISQPSAGIIRTMQEVKRTALFLRRAAWPHREVISSLERSESTLIDHSIRMYLRDVYDHAVEIIDMIETYREMAGGLLEIYLSSTSNRLNSVMMVLTLMTTIFMPLTFIVGVYGMNFKHMPELESQYGYPAVWGVMLLIVFLMVSYFRRKGWLKGGGVNN